ncbi:hypothetical protein [Coralloluteibacterium stylophorae]|uniref:Uncharacterized protein n=1 Tax=Coralloluteibacterium stylophorae TaxID=1776034 RepID=A0A8J8AXX6_9GAMM|nr:hypothetical protein [Coralloluteibacterium stylophorae]MBS7457018.1 hypothetical protein [Coralloluteibacterium stylophorae]
MRRAPVLASALALAALCACTPAPDEGTDRPVEPRSDTALRDAMQAPVDRTHEAVDAATEAAEARREAALEAAGG